MGKTTVPVKSPAGSVKLPPPLETRTGRAGTFCGTVAVAKKLNETVSVLPAR
jgi:hypothetical protein